MSRHRLRSGRHWSPSAPATSAIIGSDAGTAGSAATAARISGNIMPIPTPLRGREPGRAPSGRADAPGSTGQRPDRKSVVEGKSVSVRVDLGGRRIHKKNKHINSSEIQNRKINNF